ncbi:MAG: DHH family phosphoesterase [Planctomycetota bacterium]|jgi:nanoRNase/pAp phosphatase (c-di-AMP/oligoRNAs hydrolase)
MRPEDTAKLAEVLAPYKRILILTHNNPDPDALAAAAGMRALVQHLAKRPSTIGYAGYLTRAGNREMVLRLKLHVQDVARMDLRRFRAVILVDTQPSAGNNALGDKQTAVAVIDHHNLRRASLTCPFAAVDRNVGATSTIVYEMLKTAGVKLSANLATALFLGIKADTHDLGRDTVQRDLAAYKELFPLARHRVLAQIAHPRLSPEYFRVVHRALGTAVVFGDCVYAPVGDVPTPEFVSEVADYLVVLKGMRWSVATGRFDENLYFSIRTLTARKDAGRLLRKAMGRLGMAGGHRKMAGGVLPVSDLEPERREAAEAAVISKLLQALGANTTTSTPLLAFSE